MDRRQARSGKNVRHRSDEPKLVAASSNAAELLIQRAVRHHTSRPRTAQRLAVTPVLRAASLEQAEYARLQEQRQVLNQQLGAHSPLPTQPETDQSGPLPSKPQSSADWVTVMRVRAEQVSGQQLTGQQFAQFTALQRQVTQTLAREFRSDRGPAQLRHDTYGEHLAALQRHALTAQISRAVLTLMPPAERPSVQRAMTAAAQRHAAEAQQQSAVTHRESLQRQLAELDAESTRPVLQRIQARRGAGNPLPEAIQRHLEQGLNHDLSRVRIHDDAEADKLAKSVNALAFTTGADVFFQAGQFNPNSRSGLELLAHEVTHTVQQAQGRVGPGIDPDATLETEARTMGARLASASLTRTAFALPRRTGTAAAISVQRQAGAAHPSWRQRGTLRGNPPVRDEASPPNTNIVEDEQTYRTLRAGAQHLLQGQRKRAQSFLTADQKGVADYRYWFAHVYSYVTANEIEFCEQHTFDYPSYVMQCVLYFDKLYADNLTAVKSKVEPHWQAAFSSAARMQNGDRLPTQVGAAVWSLVASMLAHIRFDLPRAEAWVSQKYKRDFGVSAADFRNDFFRMGGVFDNASRSMFQDMQRLLPDKLNVGPFAIRKMAEYNLTPGAMRHLLGVDMSQERLTTWRRMEALTAQGKVPTNPYQLKGGVLTGNATATATPGKSINALGTLTPGALRPSMEGIDATVGNRLARAGAGAVGSEAGDYRSTVQTWRWKKLFTTPAEGQKVPLYDRASMLLTLIRNPAGVPVPMPYIGAISTDIDYDDGLIIDILNASVRRGDLALLVNIVDAYSLLNAMSDSARRLSVERLFVNGGYYRTLGVMNATNQIQKWLESGNDESNRRSAQRIYNSLSRPIQIGADNQLKKQGVAQEWKN